MAVPGFVLQLYKSKNRGLYVSVQSVIAMLATGNLLIQEEGLSAEEYNKYLIEKLLETEERAGG